MELKWKEVFKAHRKRNALYFEGKKLKSVLFSLDKRRNRHNYKDGNSFYLCFDGDSPSSKIRLVLSSVKVGDVFTVYEKISPDYWIDAGLHLCAGIKEGNDTAHRKSLIVIVEPIKQESVQLLS